MEVMLNEAYLLVFGEECRILKGNVDEGKTAVKPRGKLM